MKDVTKRKAQYKSLVAKMVARQKKLEAWKKVVREREQATEEEVECIVCGVGNEYTICTICANEKP